MRLVLAMVLAGLVALPQSVSAQDAEEDATSEPNLKESAPTSEPAPEEPALQLKLDAAGVDVVPSPPRTVDAYMVQAMQVRRAKIGLGVSAVSMVVGAALAFGGGAASICLSEPCSPPGWATGLVITGSIMAAGGAAGMVASGILLGKRKRNLPELHEAPRKLRLEPPSPDDEAPTRTEPSRMRGPSYRPH
jgi:hypothetical protein